MAGVGKELTCPSCFVVAKGGLVIAVLLRAFESGDRCRAEGWKSRVDLLLGLQQLNDSGTPKFPPREAELTTPDTNHPRADPCRPTTVSYQFLSW